MQKSEKLDTTLLNEAENDEKYDDENIGHVASFCELLSENEDEPNIYNGTDSNILKNSGTLQAENLIDEKQFEFSPSNDLCSILEKHDSYLILLKKSDGRLNPVPPLNLISYPCKCRQRCDALLSM